MTKKNRKLRRLRELHPDLNVKILYQRDYLALLVKHGLEEALEGMPEVIEALPLRFDDVVPPSHRRARSTPA
ncbi:MAG TPA: hypothetical protein VM030_00595 [Acidimicrobiales bacterium]|nr:hypothetical protein [Acidimicrobiales bacterium]